MISLEKLMILTPLQKLPKNVGELGNLIAAKGFEKLLKVQNITQSGHTESNCHVQSTYQSVFKLVDLWWAMLQILCT